MPITILKINLNTRHQFSSSLVEMWECSLQQVGHELLHVGHVLYGCDVRPQWHSYPVHFHQAEHVCQDGRVHHQSYIATQLITTVTSFHTRTWLNQLFQFYVLFHLTSEHNEQYEAVVLLTFNTDSSAHQPSGWLLPWGWQYGVYAYDVNMWREWPLVGIPWSVWSSIQWVWNPLCYFKRYQYYEQLSITGEPMLLLFWTLLAETTMWSQ